MIPFKIPDELGIPSLHVSMNRFYQYIILSAILQMDLQAAVAQQVTLEVCLQQVKLRTQKILLLVVTCQVFLFIRQYYEM